MRNIKILLNDLTTQELQELRDYIEGILEAESLRIMAEMEENR